MTSSLFFAFNCKRSPFELIRLEMERRRLSNVIYCRLRNWKDRCISCPACHEEMTLEEYRSTHSRSRHGMDEKVTCIFCRDFEFLGSYEDLVHQDGCTKRFMSRQTVDPAIVAKRRKMRSKISFWSDNNMHCPHCDEEMTFATYQSHHAKENHDLNCIYCKDDQPHEPLDCFFEFIEVIKRRKRMPPVEIPDAMPDEDTLCECVTFKTWHTRLQMDGRDYDERYPLIYEDFPGNFPELRNPGFFPAFSEESGLGHEASALFRMYFSEAWTLYHVYVRAFAYEIFVVQMPSSVVVSPFWCLCDGGDGVTELHRHMIVASANKAEFKSFMNAVRLRGVVSKAHNKIESGLHLANTIHYVGDKKSICQNRDTNMAPTRDGHYCICRPVHDHSVVAMCTTFPEGMEMWLNQKNGAKSIIGWNLETLRDQSRHTKYRVKILEIMQGIKHCPVPLRYEPDLAAAIVPELGHSLQPKPVGHYPLYWFEGETMLVGCVADEFNDYRHFMQHQVDLGNSLWTRMRGKYYTLNKTQVTQAHVFEHATKEVARQKDAEIVALRCDLEDAHAERDCLRKELDAALAENDHLSREIDQLRRLDMDHMFKIAELERKIADQKMQTTLEILNDVH